MSYKHKPFLNERNLAHRTVIGRKIRQLREEIHLSLSKASRLCGISGTHLSELEKGRISPTVNTMLMVANGFGKPLSFFLPDECLSTVQLTRLSEQESRVFERSTERILSGGFLEAQLTGSQLILEKEGIFEPQINSQVEGIGVVLEGEIELVVDGEKHRLKKGDTLHVKGKTLHVMKNVSRGRAEVMWFTATSPHL